MKSLRHARIATTLVVLSLAPAWLAAAGDPLEVDPPEVPVGGIAIVRVDAVEPRGTFEQKPLRFFRSGSHAVALVGIDLDHPPGRYRLRVSGAGGLEAEREIRVLAREFPEERLTVPREYTELGPKTLRRVEREKRLLDSLWSKSAEQRLWQGAFVMPAEGASGSPFGLRRFFNGERRSPHAGIDIRAPVGAPVRAANRGRVVLARELFFTGKTVVLDHGLGLFTTYVHLSDITAVRGRMVDRGALIGKVGATGRATGPHLHFAARIGEARVDPAALLGRSVD